MTETDLMELAAKVEVLEGPDRDSDWRAHKAAGLGDWPDVDMWPPFMVGSRRDKEIPFYTASIDAAMSLVPEGWSYWDIAMKRIGTGNDGARAEVSRLLEGNEDAVISFARTPALALCCAAIRARASLSRLSPPNEVKHV